MSNNFASEFNSLAIVPFNSMGLFSNDSTRFDGNNFYRWEDMMVFLLKQLKNYYVLSDICPATPAKTMSDAAKKALEKVQKWKDDDYLCRHHILNSLTDALYNQFKKKNNNAKDLWEGIRTVYVADETSTKKFQVSNYIDYVMVDSKPILEQYFLFCKTCKAGIVLLMSIKDPFGLECLQITLVKAHSDRTGLAWLNPGDSAAEFPCTFREASTIFKKRLRASLLGSAGIKEVATSVQSQSIWIIGNDHKVNFWSDEWLQNVNNDRLNISPNNPKHLKAKVSDFIKEDK
ncbi:hypothetical protein GIB67_003295 [Kingdonia uniflora]|uniref:Uncharacterized protein n=1 Tax=Kingdonia uniflora TaxID=39325 RepID=A0A7J7P8Q3_9MAGN|nr:hypothetical protein GIB67_003295 [Kingdonia uniflora]